MPKGAPSQNFVPIKEVRDGIVVLKDGGLRAILLASSINLSLKSEQEQKAVILQFQNFLNSLDFSTQIVVQSRRLDIRPYLITLEERYKEQKEDLLRVQTREYIEFIKWFTDSVNIMNKSFFIVVSYSAAPLAKSGKTDVIDKLFSFSGKTGKKENDTSEKFEEKRTQLEQRIAVIEGGLSQLGIRVARLGTQEAIELFHTTFNPGDTQKAINLEGGLPEQEPTEEEKPEYNI